MPFDLSWKSTDMAPFLAILTSSILFCVYWFLFVSQKIRNWFSVHYAGNRGKVAYFIFIKYAGLFILGIVPLIIFTGVLPQYSWSDYGLSLSKGTNLLSLGWIFALGIPSVTVNWFASRREESFPMYPQLRIQTWNVKMIIIYATSWAAYLFGYELLFRGLLFIPLVDTLGVWPAIAINVALYGLSHVPKGGHETIGAFILGLVLCLITLQTGTLWVAFFVHVILALSNSFIALAFHPEMKVVKIKRAA